MNLTQKFKNPSLITKSGLLVGFLILAVLTALVSYSKLREFFLQYNVTSMQGLAIVSSPTQALNELGTPIPNTPVPETVIGPVPRPWDGASRVTVLVMGLDYGDWSTDRSGPSHTDTMILLTIDPLTMTAGIMNIPRDLWVNVPDFGYYKINTAFYLGELNKLPDGGPGLAMKTVESLLGVPIDYYAQIDFTAFEKFIDDIGGIEVNVPNEIKVDPIGKHNTVDLKPGLQKLDGPVALAYARARYTDGGDFDRGIRQRQVIMAIRDRILDPTVFPNLITKAPDLYNELAAGIHTNMTLDQAIQLGWLVKDLPADNIQQGGIAPPEQVLFAKSPDGTQDILKPVPDKIRQLRDKIFGFADSISPLSSQSDLASLMKIEGARIQVLNATSIEGLATNTQQYLISQGAQNVTTGNSNKLLVTSQIIDHTGRPYTRRYLVDLLKINQYNIFFQPDPSNTVDVTIILGSDWANNNPMPR